MTKRSLQSISNYIKRQNKNTTFKESDQLWWNKYTYRLSVFVPREPRSWHRSTSSKEYWSFIDQLEQSRSSFKNSKIRSDWEIINFYTTDLDELHKFIKDIIKPYAKADIESFTCIPQDFNVDSLKHKKLCNHIPFKKYKFKVHFRNTWPYRADEEDIIFIEWLLKHNKNGEKPYKLSGDSEWRLGMNRHAKGSVTMYLDYIYVEDSKYLSWVSFRAADSIQKIIEYIPKQQKDQNGN